MNRLFQKLRMPLRIALLMLLLSMQSFTLAHELDQSIIHDGGVCAVCSIGGNHDGAITSHQDCPVYVAGFPYPATCGEYVPIEQFRSTQEARAPPPSL